MPSSIEVLVFRDEWPQLHACTSFERSNFRVAVIVADYEQYVSGLPPLARGYLSEVLDWDNKGVNKDLDKIAHFMTNWEEELSSGLEIPYVEIENLKVDNKSDKLLRYFVFPYMIVATCNEIITGERFLGNGRNGMALTPPMGNYSECVVKRMLHL